MKDFQPLRFLLLAFFVVTLNACAQSPKLPVITITANTELNATKKVTAHMKTDGYDGNIGIKLRGNSSLSFNQKK